ncbi:MAG TPA: Gfo/Idh/MocA family oxidoreductase [Candidatus Hydrogenedens sp.]|nr:Gfo/Idh/MocA family oxidoreductase [Candidatus Hydrogenedens sp.]HOL19028.1 Gfo/Idh/MocA family oxidoreductase [Candidatus Hydrogenedens sp.]HPP57790.1 Gfo/Idh/MocA family oxidoreductase [Candidatus Hydrogenedens sp.]
MPELKVAFVGLGNICRERHIPGLRQIPDITFMGVVNRTEQSTKRVAKEFNIPKTYSCWEELVQDKEVDIVWIGTWPYLHAPVSISALKAGKHVFCQARMAMNLFEAKQMYETACRTGKVAGLCPVPFGLSYDKTIARLRREGTLGDIHLIRITSLCDFNLDPNKPVHWRKDHRLSGQNVLTLGMYIELIHRWFGWTKSVFGTYQIFTPTRKTETGELLEIQIPDQVTACLELDCGATAQLTISGMSTIPTETVEIITQNKTLFYDVLEDVLYEYKKTGDKIPIQRREDEYYDLKNWSVEKDFIDAVLFGKSYHPNFEDGLHYMEVLDAIYQSAQINQKVILH